MSKKLKAALLTGGLFFILFLGWLKLGDIYGTDKEPAAYVVMDYLEKNHFLSLPGLEFKDLKQDTFDIAQLPKDRIYILNFWATWCEPCAQEFPSMVKLLEAYPGKIHILAVSNDSSVDDIDTFARAFNLSGQKDLTLLWDKDSKLSKKFEVGRLPESFIFDKQGRLIKKIVGTRDWAAEDAILYFKQLTQ
jgi:cytochrome c biogenesis protein CcmG, thiol:disulfide interchange protein DsbE